MRQAKCVPVTRGWLVDVVEAIVFLVCFVVDVVISCVWLVSVVEAVVFLCVSW